MKSAVAIAVATGVLGRMAKLIEPELLLLLLKLELAGLTKLATAVLTGLAELAAAKLIIPLEKWKNIINNEGRIIELANKKKIIVLTYRAFETYVPNGTRG